MGAMGAGPCLASEQTTSGGAPVEVGCCQTRGPNGGGQAGFIRPWTEVTRNIVFNNQAVVSAVGATQAVVGG